MTVGVRVDLDLAAIALDHDGGITEQSTGVAMHGLITRVENALQAATGAQRIEDPRQGVDRRAQAQGVAQVDHALQLWRPVHQWHEGQAAVIQRRTHLLPVTAQRDVQFAQQLLAVQASGRVGAAAVHENPHAVLRQALGRQQIPRQVPLLAGIGRPVQIHCHCRRIQAFAQGFGETRHLLEAFFLVPQQHQECAELGFLDLFIEHHAHGFAGLDPGQVTSAALAFAKDPYELGERMLGGRFECQCWVIGHKQFVGLGRPASFAASLAGVPLNSRFRCRLLPFSGPSFNAVYLINGRVAGDSWNSA
ncbi:hypothetical protein D9M71_453460 [compost metagenome]